MYPHQIRMFTWIKNRAPLLFFPISPHLPTHPIAHKSSEMSLMKIGDDVWTGTAIKSTFKILVPGGKSRGQGTISGSAIVCGLGWRFSSSATAQSSNHSTIFVGPGGGTRPTWHISVFFDPHLIGSAAYGLLSFSIAAQHLFVPTDANHSRTLTLPYQNHRYQPNIQIGSYIYTPGLRMAPTIAITVGLPAETGLSIPRSIDGKLERMLADTMTGKEAVDVKFYAFTRKTSDYVTHPQPIFAKSTLLEGYSGELDLMISGGSFGEAKLVDLDDHHIDTDRVDDYDYMSDSDLESDDEGMEDDAFVKRTILLDASDASFATREANNEIPLPPSIYSNTSDALFAIRKANKISPLPSVCSDIADDSFSIQKEVDEASAAPSIHWDTAGASFAIEEVHKVSPPQSIYSDISNASSVAQEANEVPLPQSRAANLSGRMGRAVILRGTAFKTWQALLYYLYTSKLSFSSAPQPGGSGFRTPQCSAKSMYRLADKLGLDELKAVSLSSIKANLSSENIIRQVFSKFISRYSEVQDIEVEFVLNNFPALKEEIDKVLDELCQGDRPYCSDVLRKIVAGRNSSRVFILNLQG
ncbi:hypothetical protein B0H13DRAFT_2323141 [Mycena leptocephala]|nr:hypothetical protein B0H13DRAFT_2323141 [Mycena leptocephala]